jgi:hypothetical protein
VEYAAIKGFKQITSLCVTYTNQMNKQRAFLCALRIHVNWHDRIAIIRCLVKAGVQTNHVLEVQIVRTIFDSIVQPHNDEFITLLLSVSSLGLEKTNMHGFTPLLWAIQQGSEAYVRLFLSAGSNPMVRTNDGATALILATQLGDLMSFRCILVHTKCEPEARDKSGRTALSWCSNVRKNEVAEQMISALLQRKEVDPNSTDCSGQTVLIRAVRSGNVDVVRALLESLAIDPNRESADGSTPLGIAFNRFCETEHQVYWTMIQLLLLTFKVNPDCCKAQPRLPGTISDYASKELHRLLEAYLRCQESRRNPPHNQDQELRDVQWSEPRQGRF